METFHFMDGVVVSVFSMAIVFVLLLLLAGIISLLRFLPGKEENKKAVPAKVSSAVANADDTEERMVAMLIASCMAKESYKGDVRVVSCERVK